jgi:thiosulfate/3-mercaptopyruvate sulfurtransferase
LEVWEQVLIEGAGFVESNHGKLGCVSCHGGDDTTMNAPKAHVGIVADPSPEVCADCHAEIVDNNTASLHTTLHGFATNLEKRGGDTSDGSNLSEAMENHCSTCHTSCGQCHVSRPESVGGGFIASHIFNKTPSSQYNCVACHGSRIGQEFLGRNEGVPGDVHWIEYDMVCTDCHGAALHGDGQLAEDRYHNDSSTSCLDCHEEALTETEGNPQHEQHLADLACQVCHSIAYKNCSGCHVESAQVDQPCGATEPYLIQFKIGLNPIQSAERPQQYVVLRHVPVTANTFDDYGDNLLPGFDGDTTWTYASPHNVQLTTPQNASCDSCHGHPEYFLSEDDIVMEELEANRRVIVVTVPD